MSDQDAAPDPMDKAYGQAEAVLEDEAARAARRARVLGAVAREAQATQPVSRPSRLGGSWGRGGWLAAASVAALSALVSLRFYPPPASRPAPPPAKPAAAAAPAPAPAIAAAPAVRARAPALATGTAPPAIPSGAEARSAGDVPVAAASPPPPLQTAPAPAPPPPPAAMSASDEAVVVTSRRVASPPAAAQKSAAASGSALAEAAVSASPAPKAARLRAAADNGRIADLTALLSQGEPVDAADGEGETALMKAVRANHPAAAALLRRHGADLDLKNRAGASARDMAASIGDPELNRALGLAP